ncbi:hypothetical protein QE152_g10146 [Popillia japonica]|uniref:Uncharacterized protein n=1 Tax=Popillia japonica TaxID=7064 RepID=A0AAW1LSD9_POPJA
MFGEISLKLTNMEEKLSKNTEVIERLKTENSELKSKIEVQEKRLEIVEKQIRRNNIVIQGIEDGGNDNVKDKVKELFTRIGADVKIEKDITELN